MNEQDGPTLRTVAEGVFAWIQPDGSWWVNNAGAVGAPDGVILIDTCATEHRTRAMLSAIARATDDAPITCAVNTHHHGDHTYGNSLLPTETMIIAHEETRAGLLADPIIDGCPPFWDPVPDWGNVTRRLPSVTCAGLGLHLGSRRVEVLHPGYPAHTRGDMVAWLPEQRVLFAGDLIFNRVTPLVLMGSVEGASRALEWIAELGAEHVIPGHGPLIDALELPGVLDLLHRYYRFIQDTARAGLTDGLTPLEAARRCDMGTFADLPDAERVVLNLHRAYADAQGTEPDLIQAFTDAVAYRGGPLRTIV